MKIFRFTCSTLYGLCAVLAAVPVSAQSPATPTPPASSTTIPAIFLSDIHLDPFHDPPKVKKLDAAPLTEWSAILAAPDSPNQKAAAEFLQGKCPVSGTDTTNTLWQSSLRAIHTNAAHAKFLALSGDLLAHQFDCKYKTLLTTANHASYLAFVEKTIRYQINGLRAALPGVPMYLAMGNNDSGCADYQLDAAHDEFLALTAKIVAETLPTDIPGPDSEAALTDFSTGGYYAAPLAGVPNTRILVLDDLFLSIHYATCANQPNPAAAAAQIAWLTAQLASAREQHQHIWILGHIPPVVDVVNTVKRSFRTANACDPKAVALYLRPDPDLAALLAANSDVISLALFGHTHIDEFHLFKSASSPDSPGVPVKVIGSITSTEGQRPTFTLAKIDPASAQLKDYTVIMASNLTGIAATWAPEYTYSTTYHQPAYDAASLDTLITGFQADRAAATPASDAYLHNIYAGDASTLVRFVWPQYTCAMNHTTAADFSACTCANAAAH